MIWYCGFFLIVVVGTALCSDVISQRRHTSGIDFKLKCPGRNRCSPALKSSSIVRDAKSVICHRDDLCRTYDDCCEDYSTGAKSRSSGIVLAKEVLACQHLVFSHHQFTKTEFQSNEAVYFVSRCPSTYKVEHVIRNCHVNEELMSEPFHQLPVNGRKFSILYRNYFCAVCNGEENVVFWTVVKDVSLEILESLRREEPLTAQNRGFLLGNDFRVRYPAGYAPRSCQQVVARCRSDWKDDLTKEKCENTSQTATAVVYSCYDSVNRTAYRNQYCALCNFETGTKEACSDKRLRANRQKLNSTLGILQIDLNLRQVTIADASNSSAKIINDDAFLTCKSGWIYDPFGAACIPVFCGNGYKLSNGGCIRLRKREVSGEEEKDDEDCSRNMNLDENEYERLDKDFLFVKLWNVTLSPGSYRIIDSTLYLCHPKTETEMEDVFYDSCSEGILQLDEDEYIVQADGSVFVLGWNLTLNADEYRLVGLTLRVCRHHMPTGDLFANCNKTVLSLRKEQYNVLANDSVFAPELDAIFNPGEYEIYRSILFVCSSFTPSDSGRSIATLVGLVISLISLVVLLVIYTIFSELRNTPGKCVICLAVSLFVGQFSFCFVGFKGAFCFYLAAIVHYAFLASFGWTSVLAFDICRTFLSHLAYSDGGTKSRRFLYYSAFAWGLPLVIVVPCLCLDFFGIDNVFRPGYGDGGICWISRRISLIVFFIVPLGVSLVGNFVMFFMTVYRLCQSVRTSEPVLRQTKSKDEIFVCVKLSFIMGLTWVFAFLGNLTQWTAMWYLFIVFNTLQGAFLCFSFVCTKKVFRLLRPKTKSRVSGTKSKKSSFQTSSSITAPVSPSVCVCETSI